MQFGTALRSDQACAETAFQAGEEFRRYVFEVRRTCHDWQKHSKSPVVVRLKDVDSVDTIFQAAHQAYDANEPSLLPPSLSRIKNNSRSIIKKNVFKLP